MRPMLAENSTKSAAIQMNGSDNIRVQKKAPRKIAKVSDLLASEPIKLTSHLPTLTCSTDLPNTYAIMIMTKAIIPIRPLTKPGKTPTLAITQTVVIMNPAAPTAKTLNVDIRNLVTARDTAPGDIRLIKKPTANQKIREKRRCIKKLQEKEGENSNEGFRA